MTRETAHEDALARTTRPRRRLLQVRRRCVFPGRLAASTATVHRVAGSRLCSPKGCSLAQGTEGGVGTEDSKRNVLSLSELNEFLQMLWRGGSSDCSGPHRHGASRFASKSVVKQSSSGFRIRERKQDRSNLPCVGGTIASSLPTNLLLTIGSIPFLRRRLGCKAAVTRRRELTRLAS
ncbi:hypothetical protein GUJ93_ZPchr0010g8423 [Zizania palustris]|uniref:Uncharacterized protein n=1 Tax=Zizania palustris TaxID=103762 RepID=A0A8J5WAM2_ZIZPA|nr:hypothetical protein GUJ93_ZPchr0010g8423 [Zizania palustris]